MRLKHLLEVVTDDNTIEIIDKVTEVKLATWDDNYINMPQCVKNCHVRLVETKNKNEMVARVDFSIERFLQDLDIEKVLEEYLSWRKLHLGLDYQKLESNLGNLYLDTTCDFAFTKEEIKQEFCKNSEFVNHVMLNLKAFEAQFGLE